MSLGSEDDLVEEERRGEEMPLLIVHSDEPSRDTQSHARGKLEGQVNELNEISFTDIDVQTPRQANVADENDRFWMARVGFTRYGSPEGRPLLGSKALYGYSVHRELAQTTTSTTEGQRLDTRTFKVRSQPALIGTWEETRSFFAVVLRLRSVKLRSSFHEFGQAPTSAGLRNQCGGGSGVRLAGGYEPQIQSARPPCERNGTSANPSHLISTTPDPRGTCLGLSARAEKSTPQLVVGHGIIGAYCHSAQQPWPRQPASNRFTRWYCRVQAVLPRSLLRLALDEQQFTSLAIVKQSTSIVSQRGIPAPCSLWALSRKLSSTPL